MKKLVFMFLAVGLFSFLLAQGNSNTPEGFAKDDDPGFVDKVIDFSELGEGSKYDDPYHIENWVLSLDGTVAFPKNNNLTYVKVATDKSGKKSLGLRVNYPKVSIDTFAYLKPVIPIPFLSSRYNKKGMLDNVKTIRKIRLKIRSNIYPYRVYVVLQDKNGVRTKYRFNRRLDDYGWMILEWDSTTYEEQQHVSLKDKRDPIYPNNIMPGVRIDSFIFEKNRGGRTTEEGVYNGKIGVDFVAYISDLELVYDKAVDPSIIETDEEKNKEDYIDNEATFGIEAAEIATFEDSLKNGLFAKYKLSLRYNRARRNLYTPPENESASQEQAGGNNNGDTSAANNTDDGNQTIVEQVQEAVNNNSQ